MAGKAITVREGSVTIKLYKTKHATAASGFTYRFRWNDPATGEEHWGSGVDLEDAKNKAKVQARQLSQGITAATRITAADVSELLAARRVVEPTGVAVTVALQEWLSAREAAGGSIIEACRVWASSRPTLTRILLADAIRDFIAAKVAARKKARTYTSKLASVLSGLGNVHVDTLTTESIQGWYNEIDDPTTANDLIKRLTTLLNWCRKRGYLNRHMILPTEDVDRMPDGDAVIGVIGADTLRDVLTFFRDSHPQYLAAVTLAAFCGMRSDEIHSKRSDKGVPREKMPRQLWSDIVTDGAEAHLNVSVAKLGTPAARFIPLCPAAVAWLRIARQHAPEVYVCDAGAMERVRELYRARLRERFSSRITDPDELSTAISAAFPANCFRHTRISARIAITSGNKHLVADESGMFALNPKIGLVAKNFIRSQHIDTIVDPQR